MRSLRRALLWASAVGFWIGCSVNQSGLTDGGGLSGDGATGAGGGAGGVVAGRGGSTGAAGGAAGSIITGTGGGAGVGGSATGGKGGSATGGTGGGAGSIVTGSGGSGDNGGSGGDASGSGGAAGSGAAGDNGGSGGGAGTVGAAGQGGGAAGAGGRGGFGFGGRGGSNGGRGGTNGGGGRGGTGGNPCAAYPSAKAFTPPNETRVHCYWTRSSSQTWSEAQQACMLQNGHLVTILSAEENDFVVSIAQFSGTFSDTWIGATDGKAGGDRTGPGMYRWVTNEAWGYSNWASGQPDGFCDPCSTGQTCTCDHRGVLSNDGTWNDRWQDNSRSSVCEAP